MSFEMVHSRTEYPGDPILRSELAYQIRIARREPSVLNAIRDLGKTMRQAEATQARNRATAAMDDWAPGELMEAFGK